MALVPTFVDPDAELGVQIRTRREIFASTKPPFVDTSVRESDEPSRAAGDLPSALALPSDRGGGSSSTAPGEVAPVPEEYADQRFASQADAESWVGEVWAELVGRRGRRGHAVRARPRGLRPDVAVGLTRRASCRQPWPTSVRRSSARCPTGWSPGSTCAAVSGSASGSRGTATSTSSPPWPLAPGAEETAALRRAHEVVAATARRRAVPRRLAPARRRPGRPTRPLPRRARRAHAPLRRAWSVRDQPGRLARAGAARRHRDRPAAGVPRHLDRRRRPPRAHRRQPRHLLARPGRGLRRRHPTRPRAPFACEWVVPGVARLHHLLVTGRQTAKSLAVRWGLGFYPERRHRVLRESLAVREGAFEPQYDDLRERGADVAAFAAYVVEQGTCRS